MGSTSLRLGVDYGGTNLKMGLFGEDGTTVRFREDRLEEFTRGGDLLGNIVEHLVSFVGSEKVRGGGFASKGLIDTSGGTILEDIGAGELLAGLPVRDRLAETFHAPFVMENDARAYAWGEWKFGAGRGSRSMVCMTLGTGIGCALVTEGRFFEGADPLGGLLGGHISVDRSGPPCPCGSKGCLERFCSATALHATVREHHPELAASENPLAAFFDGAAKDYGPYVRTLDEFLDTLSLGIVNIIHAYGPDTVVLGGGLMNSARVILPGLSARVTHMAWTRPRGSVRLLEAGLGSRTAALGVAFHPSAA